MTWLPTKIPSSFLWRSTIFILWLFSAWAIIDESFRANYLAPRFGEMYNYPLAGVTITLLVTFLQFVLLNFLFRSHRFAKARLQDGLAIVSLLVLAIGSLFFFFVTDSPNYIYISGQFTILLILLLLLRFIGSTAISMARFFSKREHER
jgi:hypothetical protein